MKLIETPELVNWPPAHYVFIEKIGPFQDTAMAAWQELRTREAKIQAPLKTFMSLYKVEPEMMYRAGVVVDGKPSALPAGMEYEFFEGGSYKQFTLKGSYADLPEACGSIFEWLEENGIELRDDFCIEHYVNDPMTTPEDALVTNILMPVKKIPELIAKPFKA